MKLLLTSAGITNATIRESLLRLAGKPLQELKVAFIPTAANTEAGDKTWLIENLEEFKGAGFSYIDLVDIAVLPPEIWKARLESVDIMVMGGGDTAYLIDQIRKTGFADHLPNLLKTKVYMGISAGSMVMGSDLSAAALQLVYPNEPVSDQKNLGYVACAILPHLGSHYFTEVREENVQKVAEMSAQTVYALDDQSAIEVGDGPLKVIGEGKPFLSISKTNPEVL